MKDMNAATFQRIVEADSVNEVAQMDPEEMELSEYDAGTKLD